MSEDDAEQNEKKKLALLGYAREQYKAGHARFEWLEAKAARYLTILVFVIGSANVVMLPDLRDIVRQSERSLADGAFALSLAFLVSSAVFSLTTALFSMRPRGIPTSASRSEDVIPAFLEQSMADVAHGEARVQLDAAERLRLINEGKAWLLKLSFGALLTTVAWYGVTLVLWFVHLL